MNTIKARIDTRLSNEQKMLFEHAANLEGCKSLSEYVIRTLEKRSKKIVKRHETILATREDQEIFVNALLNPKEPNETLKKAFTKYKAETKELNVLQDS